jgi:hypothetical protein
VWRVGAGIKREDKILISREKGNSNTKKEKQGQQEKGWKIDVVEWCFACLILFRWAPFFLRFLLEGLRLLTRLW